MHNIAIYPGTFDPVTRGHTDLIQRAARIFDKVFVAVAENPDKTPLFSLDERVFLTSKVLTKIDNVEVHGFNSLLADYAKSIGAKVILRGLRAVSDFEFEFQLAGMNRKIAPTLETMFLTPAEQYAYISSSLVKEIARLQGKVADFVDPLVNDALIKKYKG